MWRAGSSHGGGILHIIHEGCTHSLGSCTAESVASQPTPSTHIHSSKHKRRRISQHARTHTHSLSTTRTSRTTAHTYRCVALKQRAANRHRAFSCINGTALQKKHTAAHHQGNGKTVSSSRGGGILHIIHEGCTYRLGSCTAESVASQPTPSTHIAASTNPEARQPTRTHAHSLSTTSSMWRAGSSHGGWILHIIHEGCTHSLGSCTAESVASHPTPSTHIHSSKHKRRRVSQHARTRIHSVLLELLEPLDTRTAVLL